MRLPAGRIYLFDTSIWNYAKHPLIASDWETALRNDQLGVSPIVAFEVLYTAQSQTDFEALERQLDALRQMPLTQGLVVAGAEDEADGGAILGVAPGKAARRSADSRCTIPGVRLPRSGPASVWRRSISLPICQYTPISSALIALAARACALRRRPLMSSRNSS